MTTLKSLRLENRKTAAEVAAALGVVSSTYYGYEQGIRRLSLENVLNLAKLYECTVEEIIEAQLNSCRTALKDNQK